MNQPLLAVNNLTHLYAPDKGFRNVSFELWPGEVLGIVGESGSGKTTLLKAISARLTPQQGEVPVVERLEAADEDGHAGIGRGDAVRVQGRWRSRGRRGSAAEIMVAHALPVPARGTNALRTSLSPATALASPPPTRGRARPAASRA